MKTKRQLNLLSSSLLASPSPHHKALASSVDHHHGYDDNDYHLYLSDRFQELSEKAKQTMLQLKDSKAAYDRLKFENSGLKAEIINLKADKKELQDTNFSQADTITDLKESTHTLQARIDDLMLNEKDYVKFFTDRENARQDEIEKLCHEKANLQKVINDQIENEKDYVKFFTDRENARQDEIEKLRHEKANLQKVIDCLRVEQVPTVQKSDVATQTNADEFVKIDEGFKSSSEELEAEELKPHEAKKDEGFKSSSSEKLEAEEPKPQEANKDEGFKSSSEELEAEELKSHEAKKEEGFKSSSEELEAEEPKPQQAKEDEGFKSSSEELKAEGPKPRQAERVHVHERVIILQTDANELRKPQPATRRNRQQKQNGLLNRTLPSWF